MDQTNPPAPLVKQLPSSADGKDSPQQPELLPENVTFRHVTVADLDVLVALRAAFLAENYGAAASAPEFLDALRRYFATTLGNGEYMAYLAIADAQVVATSGMVIHRHPPRPSKLGGCEAYVMNMYTLPAWRRRGLATALMKKLIDLAVQKGCERVTLHASDMGRPVYSKLGFVQADTEMRLDPRAAIRG